MSFFFHKKCCIFAKTGIEKIVLATFLLEIVVKISD